MPHNCPPHAGCPRYPAAPPVGSTALRAQVASRQSRRRTGRCAADPPAGADEPARPPPTVLHRSTLLMTNEGGGLHISVVSTLLYDKGLLAALVSAPTSYARPGL